MPKKASQMSLSAARLAATPARTRPKAKENFSKQHAASAAAWREFLSSPVTTEQFSAVNASQSQRHNFNINLYFLTVLKDLPKDRSFGIFYSLYIRSAFIYNVFFRADEDFLHIELYRVVVAGAVVIQKRTGDIAKASRALYKA